MTTSASALTWRRTNAPLASSRTDDIWFASADVGWAVNSNGNIIKTEDGGRNWVTQHSEPSTYLRCIGFSGTRIGWVGSISPAKRMFATRDGLNWSAVENLPASPRKVCGISVVDDQVVYASGTNEPRDRPAILTTTDGGAHWDSIDMGAHASLLVDIHFRTRDRGWVVGGRAMAATPGQPVTRAMVQPVVLFTADGGNSWTDLIADKSAFPHGEWGWKIFFLNDRVAFVSLENFVDGAILKSVDGGTTWQRLPINDKQDNANLEGIGFISEQIGWVGGWGSADFSAGFTSKTEDGGADWQNANEVGRFLNRFRFIGNPVTVGYASGDTVYKYSGEAAPSVAAAAAASMMKRSAGTAGAPLNVVDIPPSTRVLRADVWDRFGNHLEIEHRENPEAGERTIEFDKKAASDAGLIGPAAILRVAVDDRIESQMVPLD